MTRILLVILLPTAAFANGPGDLRALARSYYDWRDSTYPVFSSDLRAHQWAPAFLSDMSSSNMSHSMTDRGRLP